EIGALSGGDFECDLGVAVVTVENPVERFDDLGESGFFSGTEMRAGMENDERKFELGAAIEFEEEGIAGFLEVFRIRGGEVDEITGVSENAMEAGALAGFAISVDGFFGQRSGHPLHVVFRENLEDFAA